MNHTDLIKQLRDASAEMLKDVESRICESTTVWPQFIVDTRKLIAKADAHLANGGWVRVEDALPVLPEGDSRVAIWIVGTKPTTLNRVHWMHGDKFEPRFTHWCYAEPSPQPPEQTMNTVVQEHWNGDEDMARGHAAITAEMSTEVDAREAWVAGINRH